MRRIRNGKEAVKLTIRLEINTGTALGLIAWILLPRKKVPISICKGIVAWILLGVVATNQIQVEPSIVLMFCLLGITWIKKKQSHIDMSMR